MIERVAPPAAASDKTVSSSTLQRVLYGLVLAWLWLGMIHLFTLEEMLTRHNFLDPSWELCNGYFLAHRLQAGVDYVFPTTALGFFFGYAYYRPFFWLYWLWQIGVATLGVYNLAALSARFPDKKSRFLLMLLCAAIMPLIWEGREFLLIVTIAEVLFYAPGRSWPRMTLNLLALTLIAHTKISFLMLGLVILLCGLAGSVLQKDGDRKRWLVLALGFGLFYVLIGSLAGQNPGNLLISIKNNLALSLGYSTSMGSYGGHKWPDRIASMIGVGVFMLALYVLSKNAGGEKRIKNGVLGLILVVTLLMCWKEGFVRLDFIHTPVYFGLIAFLLLAAPVYFGAYRVPSVGYNRVAAGGVLLCLLCIALSGGVHRAIASVRHPIEGARFVLLPARAQSNLDREQAVLEATWHLPAVQKAVGNAPIDMFSHSQFAVLYNKLNYRPRPIYQGYAAYTPFLADMNAAFYRGPSAPPFVLFRLENLDERYKTSIDALAFLELLRSYHPVLAEKGFMLLGRNAMQAADGVQRPISVHTLQVRAGEQVTVPDDAPYHLLKITIKPTLAMKIQGVLLRQEPIYLDLEGKKKEKDYQRFLPNTAAQGFLLDPLLINSQDVARLYAGRPLQRVRHFTVRAKRGFQEPFEVTLIGLSQAVGESLTTQSAGQILQEENWINLRGKAI